MSLGRTVEARIRHCMIVVASVLLALIVLLALRNEHGTHYDNPEAEKELRALINEEPFVLQEVFGRLQSIRGWRQVVIFAPYRYERDFLTAGVSNKALVSALIDLSNGVEAWHFVLVDSSNRIIATAHRVLEPEEKPSRSIVVRGR